MLEQDPVEGRQRETKVQINDETGLSRRETKGDKGGNHEETGSNRRETKGDKGGNHDETGSSRRETKGDKGGNHVGTGSNRRETNGDRPGIMLEQDPVEGRQMETDLE